MTSADFGNDYKDETAITRNDSIATAAMSESVTLQFNDQYPFPFKILLQSVMLGNMPNQLFLKTSYHFRHNFLNKSQSISSGDFQDLR